MHVDMDAFFASVEQRDHPEYLNKPVIVGAIPGGRGVVAAASYEARTFGVHSAMPINEAYRRCPDGVFVRPSGKLYSHVAHQVQEIFCKFSPRVEPVSIDEAYIDITGCMHGFSSETHLGRTLKETIQDELSLGCSVGIASNRSFSKLAANMQKPDGLTIIHENDIHRRIYPLPVESLSGIGEATLRILHPMGIRTIGQLAGYPEESLRRRLGSHGAHMAAVARGEGSDAVRRWGEIHDEKSIGNEHTFGEDTGDVEVIEAMLLRLSEKTGRRLRRRKRCGRTIVVKLRYANFHTITRRATLPQFINEDLSIYETARSLLQGPMRQQQRKIRLIGVTITNLQDIAPTGIATQMDLFSAAPEPEPVLDHTIDQLKSQFGDGAIERASVMLTHSH
jgi:DNA polymerase IV